MSTAQKEFIVGCFIGGLVGATAALLVPKGLLNGVNGARAQHFKNNHHGRVQKTHATSMHFAAKKPKAKRPIKHSKD